MRNLKSHVKSSQVRRLRGAMASDVARDEGLALRRRDHLVLLGERLLLLGHVATAQLADDLRPEGM
jgi:hypothetical protein